MKPDWDDFDKWAKNVREALSRLAHETRVRGGDGLDHDPNCCRCRGEKGLSMILAALREKP